MVEGVTRQNPGSTIAAVELVELDRGACLSLLTDSDLGRVVFTEAALPAAEPVNYVLDGQEVLFLTASARTLTATLRAVVAFQANEIDPLTHTGWSVLGIGQAYEVADPERLAALAGRGPNWWASGRTARVVAIPLQRLTGHRLSLISDAGGAG